MDNIYDSDSIFSFDGNMPTVPEVLHLIREIDINKSSCVENISSNLCKTAMLAIPGVICDIMCKSLTLGVVPSEWTKGVINILPKGGELSNPGNWRPITQTSIFGKILEKLVQSRLLKYLMDNHILSDNQFGFLPGRSTQLAVFELLKHVYSALNNKKIFGAICLDVSKAFDCIDHSKLFDKMKSCGLNNQVIKWFKSYFRRSQSVRFNDQISPTLPVETGIGQGTILGPLVFIFYINDVISRVANLKVNMYADDCLIYSVGNNWNTMFPKIQEGLNSFQKWCYDNCLKLNVSKTKSLLLGSGYKTKNLNLRNKFELNGEKLEFTDVYNYLGILLDKNMTLIPLLTRVKHVVSNKIYMLVKIRYLITCICALSIYKQTILPLLDFCGFVLISCNISDRSDLQTMQNHALRVCYNVRLRDRVSIRNMHIRANLLSLEQRRQIQILSMMFIYKQRHVEVGRVYVRPTRAAERFAFVRERYNCVKYKNSPYYKGSLLWDALPPIVCNCQTLVEFKKHLRTIYKEYTDVMT